MSNPPKRHGETTDDTLLNGRIKFRQPVSGYRAAIDPVLLGASINAKPGERVLDMGSGAGAAMLCLGMRVAGVKVDGIEIQPELTKLAQHNIKANALDENLMVFTGDMANPPPELMAGGYDYVMVNPPYMPEGRGNPPPDASKRTANVEGAASLSDWVGASLRLVKRKGIVTFIQRADRLAELLSVIEGAKDENGQGAGDIHVLPVYPRKSEAANRVIVSFRRGIKTPTTMLEGVTIHDDSTGNGGYSDLMEGIFAGGAISLK